MRRPVRLVAVAACLVSGFGGVSTAASTAASAGDIPGAGTLRPALPPTGPNHPGFRPDGRWRPTGYFASGISPVPVWVRPGGPTVVVVRVEAPEPPPPGPITAADLPAVPGYRPAPEAAPTLYVVDGARPAAGRSGGARIVSVGEPQPIASGFGSDSATAPRIIRLQAE